MKCAICKGTGFVRHFKDAGGEDVIEASLSDEVQLSPDCSPINGLCPRCEGSGKGTDYQDFDTQMGRINLPPDDDGTPGESIDIYCERTYPVGSGKPVRAEVSFVTGTNKFVLIGLSVGNLKVLTSHLRDYADRMGRW